MVIYNSDSFGYSNIVRSHGMEFFFCCDFPQTEPEGSVNKTNTEGNSKT